MYGWFISLYSKNKCNIVKQLYSNKNSFLKRNQIPKEKKNLSAVWENNLLAENDPLLLLIQIPFPA